MSRCGGGDHGDDDDDGSEGYDDGDLTAMARVVVWAAAGGMQTLAAQSRPRSLGVPWSPLEPPRVPWSPMKSLGVPSSPLSLFLLFSVWWWWLKQCAGN